MAAEHSLWRTDARGHNERTQSVDDSTPRTTERAPVPLPRGEERPKGGDDTPRAIYQQDLVQYRARMKAWRELRELVRRRSYQVRFEDMVPFEDFSRALDEFDRARQEAFVAETWTTAWKNWMELPEGGR